MPAGYTHYCFGKDVYKHLDEQNIKDLLLRNENCFLIGLHGPDIFFYERWNKIARKMHQEKPILSLKRHKILFKVKHNLLIFLVLFVIIY